MPSSDSDVSLPNAPQPAAAEAATVADAPENPLLNLLLNVLISVVAVSL